MTKIFNRAISQEYTIQCTIPTTYGELVLSNYGRDGYDCVLVYATDEYSPRPVLIRIENNVILWGAFYCANERVEVEHEGETYYRDQTRKTEWFPLIVAHDFKEKILLPAIKVLEENR